MTDLELDKRFDAETEPSVVGEGTAFKVAPTKGYNVQLKLYKQEIGADATRPWELDRAITTFQCPITEMSADGEREVKIGSALVAVSHEVRRTSTGDLDKLSLKYTQLVKALQDIDALPKDIIKTKEVWEAAATYPVNAYVLESFKVPNPQTGEWMNVTVRRPEDNEKIKVYKENGYTAKNYVARISKFRQDE